MYNFIKTSYLNLLSLANSFLVVLANRILNGVAGDNEFAEKKSNLKKLSKELKNIMSYGISMPQHVLVKNCKQL